MRDYARTWHCGGRPLSILHRFMGFSLIPEQGPGELSVVIWTHYLRQTLEFPGISCFKPGQSLDGDRARISEILIPHPSHLQGPEFCSLAWLSQRVTFCQGESANVSVWQRTVLLEDMSQIFLNSLHFYPCLLKSASCFVLFLKLNPGAES